MVVPAAAPVADVELDLPELWVRDLRRTRHLLTTAFGFEPLDSGDPDALTGGGSGERAFCLGCGDFAMILRQGGSPHSPVARHVAVHGDTVGDLALCCPDVGAVVERALAYGLEVTGTAQCPRIDLLGDRTICHSVRTRRLAPGGAANRDGPRLGPVDHVAYCLPWGVAERVARVYQEVFGLCRIDVGDCEKVGDDRTGLRSVVLRSRLGFTVVLTEPATREGTGQTRRFIDAHAGPGVQHVAIACDDLMATVEGLRRSGVRFLPIPGTYYAQARQRLRHVPLPWDTLQRLEILVDTEDVGRPGLLFQLFTRPITDRGTFFFEFIQRCGATGFGAGNVRHLFAAVAATMSEPGGENDGSGR